MIAISYPHRISAYAVWPTDAISKIDWSKIPVYKTKKHAHQICRQTADSIVAEIKDGKCFVPEHAFNLARTA